MTASDLSLTGKTIGDFVVEERIGQGGMATVYRATQRSIHREVALKIINVHDEIEGDSRFSERFANESAIIASLEHIHILPVYAYGIHEDYAYLAMRLLRGGSLKDLLKPRQPLPLEKGVHLFDQVAKGLAYAHSRAVIHRDLKPANVMLDDNDNAYLTDFGLAKALHLDNQITQSRDLLGTPLYIAPELLRGELVDHRADVYSMGVVLYHILTGRTPFGKETDDVAAIMYKHLEVLPPAPRQYNPQISVELENVIQRALLKNPEDRFASMGEFAGRVLAASGVSHSSSSASYPRVAASLEERSRQRVRKRRPVSWRRQILTGIAAGLLLLVCAGALLLINREVPIPAFEVLAGATAQAESLIPDAGQIALAQRKLGEEGFIAVLLCNMDSEYFATLYREIVAFGREAGIPFRNYVTSSDAYRQRLELEKALSENARGIILCPLDMNLLDETLQTVEESHLPLVLTEPGQEHYGGTGLTTSNYDMGRVAGRLAGEIVRDELDSSAEVIILDYPDLETLVERANGLEAGLLEIAPDAHIIGRYKGAAHEFAYASVSALIKDGVEFNIILSINDAGAYGAIDAMEEAGIDPASVMISSVDAEQLAQEYIRQGHFFRGSLEVARTESARAAVNLIIRMLAGAKLPETVVLPPGKMITAATLSNSEN